MRAWARVIRRIHQDFPRSKDPELCQIRDPIKRDVLYVTDNRVISHLRQTCSIRGQKNRYGIEPEELGTRSIRSGAAMSLFLQNFSIEKIKILGRWSSDAFLVYIRPQVLEWTNNMSDSMADLKQFTDLAQRSRGVTNDRATSLLSPRF